MSRSLALPSISLRFWARLISSGRRYMASGIKEALATQTELEAEPKSKKPRPFDYTKYNRRRIALRVAYLGAKYQGFVVQEDTVLPTVESCLFEALKTTRLVEDMRSCSYSKCGRTDAGVSALGQVISLEVRSNLLEGPGVIIPEDGKAHTRKGDTSRELPYAVMLNRNLPETIRVTGWCNVPAAFHARFSCKSRTYKYFFPRGNMDLDAMRKAAEHFIGEHDFRNLCKMDISGGVTNFVRTVEKIEIEPITPGLPTPYQMCEATLVARSFLQHQVRCIMSLLFLVGNGLEQPSIVPHILNVEKCPRKPTYGMASPEPLVLFDCRYDEKLDWRAEKGEQEKVFTHFQKLWTCHSVETVMVKRMLDSLTSSLVPRDPPVATMAPLLHRDHRLGGVYKPLLKRPTSHSFEEAYEHHIAKKRRKQEEISEPETD